MSHDELLDQALLHARNSWSAGSAPINAEAASICRSGGPATSVRGANRHVGSGKISERREQVLKLVEEYPGRTSNELAAIFVDRHRDLPVHVAASTPNKRLNELERLWKVIRGRERECSRTSYDCVTWWPRKGAKLA